MKVEVPQRIKMGLHVYELLLNPHLWHDEKLAGCVNYRLNEIELEYNLSLSERTVSLIHEVLEVIQHINVENLSHDTLSRMAEGFALFLIDNLGMELDWSRIKMKEGRKY